MRTNPSSCLLSLKGKFTLPVLVLSFLLMPFLVVSLTLTSCKKDNATPDNPDSTGIVYLRNKSLNEIKSAIKGTWKIHYIYGGLTGRMKIESPDSYFKFLPNDSMYITWQNQANTADKAKFVRRETIYGFTAWSMDYTLLNGIKFHLIVDYKRNDTLVLIEDMPDSFGYHMTKIP